MELFDSIFNNKKTIKTYYDDGNIFEESQVNNKNQRHGTTKVYHENGKLRAEVNFTNDIQDAGTVISYHNNGVKAREVVLIENGVFNGDFTEWHENGKIKTQGVYENNICNIKKEFDVNGKPIEKEEGEFKWEAELSIDTTNIPESPVKLEDLDLDAETKQKVEDQTLFVNTDGTIDDTRGTGKYIIETMNFFANNFNGINTEEIIFDLQTQSTINYETAPYNDIDGNWHLKMGNTLMRCFSLTNFETVFGELLRLNNISEGSQMCRDDYDSFEDLTEIYKGDGFNIEVHPPINKPFRLVVLICNDDDDDDDGIELNIDQTSESNHKTLAFVISMFKLVAANGPEIEEDILNFMSDVADEYELQNFNHFFQQMFLPEYGPILLKNHQKYIKSLSEKEFE